MASLSNGPYWLPVVAAHAAMAVLLASLLAGFYDHFQRRYLRHWSFAYAALAVALGAEVVAAALPPGLLPVVRAAVAVAAANLAVFWLMLGTYEVATGRALAELRERQLTAGLPAAGVVCALLLTWGASDAPDLLTLRVGIFHLLPAVALGTAGVLLARSPALHTGLGPKVLMAALLVGAVQQSLLLVFRLLPPGGVSPVMLTVSLAVIELLVSVFNGVGMCVWLLEEERRAAAIAAREVEHLAFHDALTGLPNRRLLLDRLEQSIAQALRSEEKVVALFLDLDRFKVINDSLGHAAGDELLCSVATRLKHRTRPGDTIARIGGDEFALVFPRVTRAADAVQVAENLLRTIRAPFAIAGRELFVTTSLGLAFYPDDGTDAETLLRHADLAMYKAKASGRNNYQLFVPSMKEYAVEQLELESELRRALAGREFAVHFQPVVSMTDGRVRGVEALVRWPHRTRGMIMPDRFLPIAEQLGILEAIDDWVLAESCRLVRHWQRQHGVSLTVSVNLSSAALQRPDFPLQLKQVLTETDLHPRQLVVEITERTAMQNIEVGFNTLSTLREMGIGVAIDDFGTGYSSLSYLRQFPANALKIDKAFVREILRDKTDRAIVTAIVPLAHSLGMEVVAEGVETPEQRDLLRELGVDLAQGWLYYKALPADEMERLLAAGVAF